jgi:hypothetical protein
MVKWMTWKDVSKCFRSEWAEQWGVDASATVTDRLGVDEHFIKGSKKTFLSKYTLFTTTTGRKSAASKGKPTYMIKMTSNRTMRVNSGKARTHIKHDNFARLIIGTEEILWGRSS